MGQLASPGFLAIPTVGARARYLSVVSELRGTVASRLEIEQTITVIDKTAETYTVRQQNVVRSASGAFAYYTSEAPSVFVIDARTHVPVDGESTTDLPYAASVEFAGVGILGEGIAIAPGQSWAVGDVRFAVTSATSGGEAAVEIIGDSMLSKGSMLLLGDAWPGLRQKLTVLTELLPVGDINAAVMEYYSPVVPGNAEPPRLTPLRHGFDTFRRTEVYYIGN